MIIKKNKFDENVINYINKTYITFIKLPFQDSIKFRNDHCHRIKFIGITFYNKENTIFHPIGN